ncbi:cysteine-tRNA ligase-like, partial [Trifolium medium]|nr:cysteine-tRNA ligase-like [Trifolium medium]
TLYECESLLNQHDQTVRQDSVPSDTLNNIDNLYDVFLTSMSDDLHTPVVLAGLSDPLKSINDLLHTRKPIIQILGVEMQLQNWEETTILNRIARSVEEKHWGCPYCFRSYAFKLL